MIDVDVTVCGHTNDMQYHLPVRAACTLFSYKLEQLFQVGSKSRSVGLDLSRRPPSAG